MHYYYSIKHQIRQLAGILGDYTPSGWTTPPVFRGLSLHNLPSIPWRLPALTLKMIGGEAGLSCSPNCEILRIMQIFRGFFLVNIWAFDPLGAHLFYLFIYLMIYILAYIHIHSNPFPVSGYCRSRAQESCTVYMQSRNAVPPSTHPKNWWKNTSIDSRPLPIPNPYPTHIPNPRKMYTCMKQILLII